MTLTCGALLAVLSIWDYPARQPHHTVLRNAFVAAVRKGDAAGMADAAQKGVVLLPDDATWRYNLACAEAKLGRHDAALSDLEKAIRLGFNQAGTIEEDPDFKTFATDERFKRLVALAESSLNVRSPNDPLFAVPVKGILGGSFALGEQNLSWDFDTGCFVAHLELTGTNTVGNVGDLYFNRDQDHSPLRTEDFPGLTRVMLDAAGRERGMDTDFPNMLFPCPVFGNCSRAVTLKPIWRSLPRLAMTIESRRMPLFYKQYRSNQIWVYPAVSDHAPLGHYGDLFASVTPYWIVTQGRSWSDQYYLRAALEVSRSLPREVKREIVACRLLAPTIQTLLRRSLKGVATEADYLSPKAHPTAFPANGLDLAKLKAEAESLTIPAIPPIALIAGVGGTQLPKKSELPELTFASPCAWAFVLRGEAPVRTFHVKVGGGERYAFAQVHGNLEAATIERLGENQAKITVKREFLSSTNRLDIAVFAKSKTSDWGAPSFLSFAVIDPDAAYVDPVLSGLKVDVPDPEPKPEPKPESEPANKTKTE